MNLALIEERLNKLSEKDWKEISIYTGYNIVIEISTGKVIFQMGEAEEEFIVNSQKT